MKPLNWQEHLAPEIKGFKSRFSGSTDYESGVNDATYALLQQILIDDVHLFEYLSYLRNVLESEKQPVIITKI
jgi:hypothetical protein